MIAKIRYAAARILTLFKVFLMNLYHVRDAGKVIVGKKTLIAWSAKITAGRFSVVIGEDCRVNHFAVICASDGEVTIGDRSLVGAMNVINGPVRIGSDVLCAPHVGIFASDHIYESRDIPINRQGRTKHPITIGNDVWIGCGTKVLPGSTIGHGCVVGAGSVVRGEMDPYAVYAGSVAKKLRDRP